MSDNAKRTELLAQLLEQQLITADQLSRAKLYLQFISGTSFNTHDGAIDWLLENRIISERPVTETVPVEQNPELSSKEPEIEPEIQVEPEENISENIEHEAISEEILSQEEPEESQEQSAVTESVDVEYIKKESIVEQQPSEPAQNANPLELLMLLYMAGTINDKALKKAKKELAVNSPIDFKNSDELLIWLEQKDIVKPEPIRAEPLKIESKKQKPPQKKITSQQPIASVTKTEVLPPKEKEQKDKTKKGGCLKKLIIIGIAIAIINWYFKPIETPTCDNPDIYQSLIQKYLTAANSNPLLADRKGNTTGNILTANPVVYRFARITDIKSNFYDEKTRYRTCSASVVYQATGNDKTATDIVGEIHYSIKPTSRSKFAIDTITGKDEIIKKVADENAYYEMIHEKDKSIKAAFIQGLAQVDQFINNARYSQSKLNSVSKNIRWINVIGECEQIEDTEYSCPVEFGYKDGLIIKEDIPLTLDMPVIKKDDSWEPTDKFYVAFFKVYASALKDAITAEKAGKKESEI